MRALLKWLFEPYASVVGVYCMSLGFGAAGMLESFWPMMVGGVLATVADSFGRPRFRKPAPCDGAKGE